MAEPAARSGDDTKSQRGADTKQRILEAARAVLAEGGIEHFTTRRVATRAGVSHGMCHYYFADKSALVQDLVEHARADWIVPLEGFVNRDAPALDRACEVIAWMAEPATVDVMRVHLTLFWFALNDEAVRVALAGEYRRWRAPFTTLFEDLAREQNLGDLDARKVGDAFASAADGLVQQQSLDSTIDTRAALTALLERLLCSR